MFFPISHSQLQAGNNPIPERVLQSVESAAMQGDRKKISALLKSFIAKYAQEYMFIPKHVIIQ